MSIPKRKEVPCLDVVAHVIQIYPRLSDTTAPCCTLKVQRGDTAACVIQKAAASLGLDTSKPYELVEVREYGTEEWVLQASDLPVERALLWPQHVQYQMPQSCRYFFALRMGNSDESGRCDHISASHCEKDTYRPVTQGTAMTQPEDCKDLCNLTVLNERNILNTLHCRFHRNQIYTYASNILIAINPFKFLPIYNPKYVEMYENHILGTLDPHIFAIADAAFYAMLNKQLNQCIVISGESGSGKTQSANFLIHCLTSLSRKGCTSGVERTILGAGPVLEAFGNAKTAYNNNSSRFGKFIQVNFLEGGIVRGATIEKYLLEKCRLVARKCSERNYHVFYYLLVGASEEEKEEFKLLAPEDYNYLKQDNLYLEDQAEIKYEFKRLHQAMEMVGFLPATKKQIFSVLSAILYLGNVTYEQKADGEAVTVGPAEVLSTLSDLLKVKVDLLVEALTKRKAMTANDVLILPYTHSEAVTARDSMAKSLYSSLFDWIVLRINHALLNKRDMEESVPCLSVGILDIFGFEDFKTNSFEQFCINYANEQLQHYTSHHIFRLEQEEYLAEGITWTTVDYTDNIGCINLICKKPTGLLYLLDEESSFPHATDNTLLEKFKREHQKNPFFVPIPVLEPAFVILHYAGKVKYQIKDFRAKNTDHMRPDIVALLRSSKRSYLKQLIGSDPVALFRWGILRATIRSLAAFKEMGQRSPAQHHDNRRYCWRRSLQETRRPSVAIGRLMSQCSLTDFSFDRSEDNPLEAFEDIFATFESKKKNRSNKQKQLIPKNLINSQSLKLIVDLNLHNCDTRSLLPPHKKKKPPSISAQFQTSLVRLLDMLRKAEPFFIRCIKSNGEQSAMQFDDDLVLRQLRYTGMLETVRIKRSGYCVKYTFKEFAEEYRVLLPKKVSMPQEDIANLLLKIGIDETRFQIGRTKVFLNETERQKLQASLYREVMHRILTLQRWFRACLARKNFLMKRKAIITIQRSWRNYQVSTCYRAATVIQKAWRESRHRAEYLRQKESLRKLKLLKRSSDLKRHVGQGTVNKMESTKGSEVTEERRSDTILPPYDKTDTLPTVPNLNISPEDKNLEELRLQYGIKFKQQDGKIKISASTECPTKLTSQDQPSVQGTEERKDTRGSLSSSATAQSVPPELYSSATSGQAVSNEVSTIGPLQRSKPSVMKDRVEKWRERRSEMVLLDKGHFEDQLQKESMKRLRGQGISMSLDSLSNQSSSESDSTPSLADVKLRSRKRVGHKRRLAHPRSGLVHFNVDATDLEYWNFPLPPISPAGSFRASAPVGLPEAEKRTETDTFKMTTTKTLPSPQATPEKTTFFSRYFPRGQKKRVVPQGESPTQGKAPAEKDEQGLSPHSYYPNTGSAPILPSRKRLNPSIKISRGTRVQEQWKASMNRQIVDASELRHLDEFLGNQMNDLHSRVKMLSETEVIFLTATTQFRDTLKSMYSVSNPQINYKGLLQGYKSKVISLSTKKPDEVSMVVNLFESVLDGFIRAESKRNSLESDSVKITKKAKRSQENAKCESPLDHSFSTWQVTIVQSCDVCGSFIWGMEKACMCNFCKMICHKKCLSKVVTHCFKRVPRKTETDKTTAHFGVHINALTSCKTPVPVVLEMMLTHVEMNGLYTEGIYRKSGSVCKAKELHQLLETDCKGVCLENYPIHTVTGLIKTWLRELPEPLMTFSLYSDFLYAIDLPETSERLRAVYRKLEDLPSSNFSTLERLTFHLVKVAKEESHNRMSPNSLAIVFAPCILRCPDVTDPLLSMRDLSKTTLCLEILITEQIKRYDEKMKDIQQLEQAEALALKQLNLHRQNTIIDNPKIEYPTNSGIEVEKTLVERIKSIKEEKSILACTLPEMDQDTSDNDNLDCESMVSSDSLQDITSLDLEGQKITALKRQSWEGLLNVPSLPQTPTTAHTAPPDDGNHKRPSQSTCVPQSQSGFSSSIPSVSSQDLNSKTAGQFTDLSIPFIDEEL
ncbi:unconventional myosin-IXb isoform X2 [Brachyhypopomus gauderio]|uniref:unconventional myosin-IXb isoform X2 n=1 Tax=Brachyhypopomus gauderio TaxID=698409 RepID=UPI0040423185